MALLSLSVRGRRGTAARSQSDWPLDCHNRCIGGHRYDGPTLHNVQKSLLGQGHCHSPRFLHLVAPIAQPKHQAGDLRGSACLAGATPCNQLQHGFADREPVGTGNVVNNVVGIAITCLSRRLPFGHGRGRGAGIKPHNDTAGGQN